MNKREYLDRLESELGLMSHKDVKDILAEIGEHFDEGIALGCSEEEIAKNLGSPVELARAYREGVSPTLPSAPVKQAPAAPDTTGGRVFVVLFNIFVGVPVWLALFFIILAVCLIELAGIAGLAAIAINIPAMGGFMASGICLAVTLLFLLIALYAICYFMIKFFSIGTSSYIRWNKKLWNEGF